MTFLLLDVGNTRLKWSLYECKARNAPLIASGAEFLENVDRLAAGPWGSLPAPKEAFGCVVAGEGVKQRVAHQLDAWGVDVRWAASERSRLGLVNGYDQPARLGVDRWMAMIGAWVSAPSNLVPPCFPRLVVMVGTAVTVDAIDPQGRFLGGFILPGHGIMLRALEAGTAGLHVPTGEVKSFPTNTSDALTSGGTYAIVGAVEQMKQQLEAMSNMEAQCFLTGGAAWKMAPYLGSGFHVLEQLIFEGLLAVAVDDSRVVSSSGDQEIRGGF